MSLSPGHVVILSGHPGSGKTTLAGRLASEPGTSKVHLHTDDLWGYIKTGCIPPWLPESHAQNTMIMRIGADIAAAYARHGYGVAVDGVIRPWALAAYRDLDVPVHYVVLRVPVEEAVARCQARGGDSLTDPDIVAALHAEFADMGEHEPHVLDLAGLDPEAALARIEAAIATGRYRLNAPPSATAD